MTVSEKCLQSLLHNFPEFTEKLCGNATFDGLSAEQVLSGWLYYPTDWSKVPMIKIKSAENKFIYIIADSLGI